MSNGPPEIADREQRLDEVLAAYFRDVESGTAPERAELLRQHPDLADDLAAFFADEARLTPLAAPLRALQPTAAPRTIGNYEVLEEIGRGGMGVIYRARQRGLNRIVALKMIRAGEWANPADLRRFQAEAEAVAQLDHPNIVPVYEVGEAEGRHYMAMKLIEGGSLGQWIADLRLQIADLQKDGESASARLLATVARAVHYAHQRGILHRDLKPANILLQFPDLKPKSEISNLKSAIPLVSDFGLAKRVEGPELTETGTTVGTPGYMAPEQAAGNKAVSTAVDVYSLGAILYELLTGHAPFRGETPLATLRQVMDQEPRRPRLLNPRVNRDLETICLKCLEKEPTKRYASAAALAEDLDRFLAGESILARPVGTVERLGRWYRRNRILAGAGALAVAALVVLAVGSFLFALRERRHLTELDQVNQELRRKEDETRAALEQAQLQRAQADQSAREAEASFRLAHRAVRDFCLRLGESRFSQIPGMQQARKDLLETGLKYYVAFARERASDPRLQAEVADTHFRIAAITNLLGSPPDALAAYRRAARVCEEVLRKNPNDTASQAILAQVYLNSGALQQTAVNAQAALASYQKGRRLLERLVQLQPDNTDHRRYLAMISMNTGNVRRVLGQYEAAQRDYDRAEELFESFARSRPQSVDARTDLAILRVNRGVLQGTLGHDDEAMRLYRQALVDQERLAHDLPANSRLHADLAHNYRRVGDRLCRGGKNTEGLVLLNKARQQFEELATANPSVLDYQVQLANCYRSIGRARGRQQPDEAQAALTEACNRLEKLVRRHPEIASWKNDLATSYFQWGVFEAGRGDKAEARKAYERAGELSEQLVQVHPDNLDYRHNLGVTLGNLGVTLLELERPDDARTRLLRAIDNQQRAVTQAPLAVEYHQALVRHYQALQQTLRRKRQHVEAARLLQKGCAFLDPIAHAHPEDPSLQEDLGWLNYLAARSLYDAGRKTDALEAHRRARKLRERLVQGHPAEPRYRQDLSVTLNNLGLLLAELGRPEEGIGPLREAVTLCSDPVQQAPDDGRRRSLTNNLGALAHVLRSAGRPGEAVAVTRERLTLWPRNPTELYRAARDLVLAAAVAKKAEQSEANRYGDEALAALRQAVAAGFKDRERLAKDPAWDSLRKHDDFQKLVAALKPAGTEGKKEK